MDNDHDWFALQFWATELEKKYPETDLIGLSNKEMAEMLLSLDAAKGMPSLPDDKVYYFALASVWAVVQHGGVNPKTVPDAII